MKKLLISLATITILVSSGTSLTGCSWSTPPLTINDMNKIMNHLKKSATDPNADDHIILLHDSAGIFTLKKPSVNDIDSSSEETKSNARAASDILTSLASGELVKIVSSSKKLNPSTSSDENDSWYQEQNINNRAFNVNNFSIAFANIFCKKLDDKPGANGEWIFNNNEKDMTDRLWKNKDGQSVAQENKNQINAQQGLNYSFLKLENIYKNNKIFSKDSSGTVIKNIEPYLKNKVQLYKLRFLISFLPLAKYNYDPINFYVDINFDTSS